MLRYITFMTTQTHCIKYTVTALLVTIGLAMPVQADPLDDLFADLARATEKTTPRLEGQIVALWENSGSPSRDLLLRRGKDALDAGTPDVALDHYSALVDHAPDFAAAYNGRATAYFILGLYGPALDDLRQALVLEPRHFGAMRGVAVILENLDRTSEALDVYRAVLAIAPASVDVRAAVDRLELDLKGRAL
jgi:tetratricopeptide (TPR) repeat protein